MSREEKFMEVFEARADEMFDYFLMRVGDRAEALRLTEQFFLREWQSFDQRRFPGLFFMSFSWKKTIVAWLGGVANRKIQTD